MGLDALAPVIGPHALRGIASAQVESVPDTGAIPGDPSGQGSETLYRRDDDTLQLRLLELESDRLRYQSGQSDFWHRLLPSVNFTASLGWKDLIALEPTALAPSFIPRDAYRVTIGISLSGILEDSKHEEAEFGLMRIEVLRERLLGRMRGSASALRERLIAIEGEKNLILREKGILEAVERFDELRFRGGEIKYDALAGAKLRLIELEKRLLLLDFQAAEIRPGLTPSGRR